VPLSQRAFGMRSVPMPGCDYPGELTDRPTRHAKSSWDFVS